MIRGVPNRLTRVPTRAVPAAPRGAGPLYAVADAFMLVMLSRPETGSLRRTWVTPATILLCSAAAVLGVGVASLVALRGLTHAPVIDLLLAVLFALLAVGAACVLAVALLQRSRG